MSKKQSISNLLGSNIDDFWNDCIANSNASEDGSDYVTCK